MADTKLTALSEVSIPDFSDDLYLVDNTGPTSNKVGMDRLLGMLYGFPGGRLTLTTGVPVTTSDVTAATNVFYTPYAHDRIALYDGTRWIMYQFTERTLALGTLTAALPYDVFLYDNAGTLTLEALAWTNGTTRATALVLTNGIYLKTGALTRRYLGTFYTSATTTTEDSAANRLLFNVHNRLPRRLFKTDGSAHTYNSATVRSWNNSTANRVAFINGLAEKAILVTLRADFQCASGFPYVGIAQDATNTSDVHLLVTVSGTIRMAASVAKSYTPSVGYHFYQVVEADDLGATGTFNSYNLDAMVLA